MSHLNNHFGKSNSYNDKTKIKKLHLAEVDLNPGPPVFTLDITEYDHVQHLTNLATESPHLFYNQNKLKGSVNWHHFPS